MFSNLSVFIPSSSQPNSGISKRVSSSGCLGGGRALSITSTFTRLSAATTSHYGLGVHYPRNVLVLLRLLWEKPRKPLNNRLVHYTLGYVPRSHLFLIIRASLYVVLCLYTRIGI